MSISGSAAFALISRSKNDQLRAEGLVTTANTGEPIEGEKVQIWFREIPGSDWVPGETTKTNKDGLYSLAGKKAHASRVLVSYQGHFLASDEEQHPWLHDQDPQIQEHTVFFTDCAIYRPGQMIQYKGICHRLDVSGDKYSTLPNRKVTVEFVDKDGKEIARRDVRTNDYGSFSGSFTAPRDRLTGHVSILTRSVPGEVHIAVEEYKRPKFQVTIEAPKNQPNSTPRFIFPAKPSHILVCRSAGEKSSITYNGLPANRQTFLSISGDRLFTISANKLPTAATISDANGNSPSLFWRGPPYGFQRKMIHHFTTLSMFT